MSKYEEGMKLLEEAFGNDKDNLISLATIALEKGANGEPCPSVRVVDCYYEDGTFYAVTNAQSNKMLQIEQNAEISIASSAEMFNASAIGENLGWAMDEKNARIREKLHKTFEAWYDMANNDSCKDCVYLAIHLTKGILNINHWEKLYHMDFVNKTCD